MKKKLNFEQISKQFMEIASDRYPTADKVLKTAKSLGIENDIEAQIVVFTQFRDAVKEVSLDKIYRSVQHRDEVFNAIIEALEDLEDELEELEFEDEEEEVEIQEEKTRGGS